MLRKKSGRFSEKTGEEQIETGKGKRVKAREEKQEKTGKGKRAKAREEKQEKTGEGKRVKAGEKPIKPGEDQKKTGRESRRGNVTLRALRQYHSYNPAYFPLCFLETLFREAMPYFTLWMSAQIVTALAEGGERRELYFLVGMTLFGSLLIQSLQAFLGNRVEKALEVLNNEEKLRLYKKTLSLDYDKMENPDIRTLRRSITENSYINGYGVEYMRQFVLRIMSGVISLLFSVALLGEMVSQMAAVSFRPLSLLLFAAMLGFSALSVLIRSVYSGKNAAYWDGIGAMMLEENKLSMGCQTNGMDNRIYRQQQIITNLLRRVSRKHLAAFSKAAMMDFWVSMPVSAASILSQACTYLIVCYYCTLGAFPVGSVIKYVGYLGMLLNNLQSIISYVGSIKGNERFLANYLEYFDIPNDMYQGSLAVEKRSDKRYDIEFRNVSFRYAGSEAYVLKNINLKIKVGERLAVVGMNGSGKTTFIKLLCRLYDPAEGEIVMNDFNIRKYNYRQYLDVFSIVFQDYHLLAMSLGSNVACAAERLLVEAGFGERYERLPKKLDTPLYKNFDEDGVNISGGEAQKIALARALYRDAPFIILDEPTAALDPVAEAEIYSGFDRIVGDKTAIYISHRLSSCRFCDRIAVFDRGGIVQIGTHEELLADEKGKYYELWHAQAQYYA